MATTKIHTCNKEKEIAIMQTDVSYIKEKLDIIDHKLFGNGKPGVLADQNSRIGELERNMWKFMGGVTVVTFILSLLIPKLLNLIIGGG